MSIELCKWYNNARSPVLLMIDDLANTWVDTNKDGTLHLGDDWGYHKNEKNSSFRYLNEMILKDFPQLKVTFFVPVGVRVGMLLKPLLTQVSEPMNADEGSKEFFKSIHQHPNFELAYHGTTHGKVGQRAVDFIQEWALFNSVDEALDTIRKGKDIYQDVIGINPSGGKYCGYTSNGYSDESIDQSGFSWWCRYWNRGISDGGKQEICGNDHNPLTNFDIKRFGSTAVIDIPSTLSGSILNGVLHRETTMKGIAKRVLKKILIRWKLREITYLLEHQLVISVQEHIAPSRDDGKRQSPNIFDDRKSLRGIFHYLEDKKVWYCTGSELADYVNLRDHVTVERINENTFILEHPASYRDQVISLKFSQYNIFQIRRPDDVIMDVREGYVNLPVMEGEYSIMKGGIR
ncbi:hypothetical protein ACP8HI_04170 [Paenibacillus sp. FA6]|uniref:hypothetical protein n=1 Tax=Paenibacillus sp. FA6 TaxID=3413029 RepID=UPI003F656570